MEMVTVVVIQQQQQLVHQQPCLEFVKVLYRLFPAPSKPYPWTKQATRAYPSIRGLLKYDVKSTFDATAMMQTRHKLVRR
jgi:hypothetical protein